MKTDSSTGSKCCYKTPPLHHPNPNKADSSHLGIEGLTAFFSNSFNFQLSLQKISLSAPPKARPEVSKVAPHPWNQTRNFFTSDTAFQPSKASLKNTSFPFLFSFLLLHASSLVLSLLHNITLRTHAIHIYIRIITCIIYT